jgi:hypothetical protein
LKSYQRKDVFADELKVDFNANKKNAYEKFGSHPYYNYGSFDLTGDYHNNQ